MSEAEANTAAAPADGEALAAAATQPMGSAGQMLREAREAAGIDLPTLAVALKVSVKKLEALESDRLDQLPDAVFLRGLASSVCRVLKMDASPVLARLPQTATPRLANDGAGLNTPFHKPGDVAKMPFGDRLSRPMVLAAVAVLLGALVLILFPSNEQRAEIGAIVNRSAPATSESGGAAPAAPVSPAAPAAPTAVTEPAHDGQKDKDKDKEKSKGKDAAAPAPMPTALAVVSAKQPPAVAAAPVSAAPAPAAPVTRAMAAEAVASAVVAADPAPKKKVSSNGIVVFKTTESSWVEVTDANSAVQLSRMVEPGDTVGASGPLPLSVTIGRADVTQVTIRGKAFPLEPVTKQGVARFEVK